MESEKNIYRRLVEFQSTCPEIPLDAEVEVKTKSGGKYTFRYATLQKIREVVLPILNKVGLGYYQRVGEKGVQTVLFAVGGSTIKSGYLPTSGATMQEVGSSITYAKRYSLSAMLGVVTETDDDGNFSSGSTIVKDKRLASDKQISYLNNLITNKGKLPDVFYKEKDIEPDKMTSSQASKLISKLK